MTLAALSVVAVLDVGPAAAEATPSASPFAGSWSGTWSAPEVGAAGAYDWTISDTGGIRGAVRSATGERSGRIVGHVGADGNVTIIAYAPAEEPEEGYSGRPFAGTAEINGDGDLVASLNSTSFGFAVFVTLERN